MDTLNSIEFIDLSEVEEKEKLWILNFLHSWDANVQVPWRKPNQLVKNTVPLENTISNVHVSNNHQPNVVFTSGHSSNVNVPSHQPIYQPYTVIYPNQPIYQNVIYSDNHVNSAQNVISHYPQHVPYVENISSDSANYPYNNTQETDVHYNGGYEPEQNVPSPISNNSEVQKLDINTNKNHIPVHENGDIKSTSNIVELPQNDKKDIIVEKTASKSWASLFSQKNNRNEQHNSNDINGKSNVAVEETVVKLNIESNIKSLESDNSIRNNYDDPVYYRLGEYLAEHEIDHRTISLQPRGLINRSNYCYINSILQALLACPPVYNLLNGLSEKITTNAKRKLTPVICNMSTFVKEFHHLPAAQRVSRRVDKSLKQDPNSLINCDTPFEPNYIYKMLSGIRSDTFVVEGRQEDAEEFLGCLLNGLNDEMMELMKLVGKVGINPKPEVNNGDVDPNREWKEVTGKNKGCVTRRTEVVQTPISDIFNGHLRSRVHRAGDTSTDNVQPFFTLQLNIEKVSSVKEALEALVCKNQLEGVTSSKTNEEVEAWQQVTIEDLPYVLVLHLKCFDYKLDGCTKIIKALDFPIDLKIDGKLLSTKMNYSAKAKQYKLFAIVYHDGKEASKGHYLTDAYHVGYARWLRYDDSSVKAVPEEQVLKPHGTRVPYLLFYRRCDSIRSK